MKEPSILLVEDCADDVILIRRALQKAGVTNPIWSVENGQDAVAYLEGDGLYADRVKYPLPFLVLLDLKMPGISGFDVLKWIRHHPDLNKLRVVVLTSSREIRDVNLAYQLGANSFMVKPLDFENTQALADTARESWGWAYEPPPISANAGERTRGPDN